MDPESQSRQAVEQGLDPEPRNAVDETMTGMTRSPRRARSLMHLLGLGLLAAGVALFVYSIWYSTNGGAASAYIIVAGVCIVLGAVFISGIRDRLGQRQRRARH